MKALIAAIALLCLSSTVMAHDIYTNLRDRDGHLCCNGQDCKPVQATVLPNGNYYLPETDETIPADMATPSPDDRFDHCVVRRDPLEVRKATLTSIVAKASPASGSTNTWKATARPSSPMLAKWVLRASCRSVRVPPTVPAARPIGSK